MLQKHHLEQAQHFIIAIGKLKSRLRRLLTEWTVELAYHLTCMLQMLNGSPEFERLPLVSSLIYLRVSLANTSILP